MPENNDYIPNVPSGPISDEEYEAAKKDLEAAGLWDGVKEYYDAKKSGTKKKDAPKPEETPKSEVKETTTDDGSN